MFAHVARAEGRHALRGLRLKSTAAAAAAAATATPATPATTASGQGETKRIIPLHEAPGLGWWGPLYQVLYGSAETGRLAYERYGRKHGVSRMKGPRGDTVLLVFNQDDLRHIYQNEGKNPIGVSAPSLERYWLAKAGHTSDNLPVALGTKGDAWREARAILNPGINTDAVAKYEGGVYLAARDAVRQVESYSETSLAIWIQRASFDMFCGLAIGKNPGTTDPECASPMKEIVHLEDESLMIALQMDFLPPLLHPRNAFDRLTQAYDRIIEITEKEVRELFAQEEMPDCWFKDLRDEQNVSIRQLEHLMSHLFSVAIGTTMTALQWAIIALALHPQEQAKVYAEIQSVLGAAGGHYKRGGVKMPHLEAFLRETNRVYPPLRVAGPRVLEHDLILPHSRIQVPAGTTLVPATTYENRDTLLNADANEFRPDRFLRENLRASKSCPFASKMTSSMTKDPFGNGSRVCLGKRAAELEIRMLICELLKEYSLELDPANRKRPALAKHGVFNTADPFPPIKLVPRIR